MKVKKAQHHRKTKTQEWKTCLCAVRMGECLEQWRYYRKKRHNRKNYRNWNKHTNEKNQLTSWKWTRLLCFCFPNEKDERLQLFRNFGPWYSPHVH